MLLENTNIFSRNFSQTEALIFQIYQGNTSFLTVKLLQINVGFDTIA
jgi:hypothetical protein